MTVVVVVVVVVVVCLCLEGSSWVVVGRGKRIDLSWVLHTRPDFLESFFSCNLFRSLLQVGSLGYYQAFLSALRLGQLGPRGPQTGRTGRGGCWKPGDLIIPRPGAEAGPCCLPAGGLRMG
jgi:hypothetical protein